MSQKNSGSGVFTQEGGRTNTKCTLARNGFKPYDRCDYCELHVKSCMGMHLNLFTMLIGFSVLMFLFLEDPLFVRLNIMIILALFFALGYEMTVNTDALARTDFKNTKLNDTLHAYSTNLEDEVQKRTKELQHLAVHDSITGLFNRHEFEKRLKFALKHSSTASEQSIMCYIDLDQFKIVNDTSGHIAGDELLKQISMILQKNVAEKDVVARLGGDEFGVLFVDNNIEEAHKKATKILKAIKEYRFSWEGKIFVVGASMGMVPMIHDCCSLIDIMSAADTACYQAKEAGRNCIHIASNEDEKLQERRGEIQWLPKLREGLEKDKFILFIQPITALCMDDEDVEHYEVLIRFIDERRTVLPMAFIPTAERYGVMKDIDRLVIEKTFEKYAKLQEVNKKVKFSINLSGTSLNDNELGNFIEEMFQLYKVAYKDICFEITETAAVANLSLALEFIKRMRNLGCEFSLDDFGSGLSSFSYLQNMPVDYLKIDGSFVRDIDTNKVNKAMVKSINEVSHTMEMKTVCEFVESKDVEDVLKELDVDFAQGYYYTEPVSIETLF